jgi:3'(2'), 5'-bisphosphate nucleotidase
MPDRIHPRTDDHALARQLADEAGRALLTERDRAGHGDPAALKAAGDRLSHELLVARLAAERPGDAVLSEEGADDPRRLGADRVWIVDPLDGTREYSEAGRADWAVHVALWERGELVAGAVGLPAQGRTLGTDTPPATPPWPTGNPPRLVASRTRAPRQVLDVAAALGGEILPMGSAGAKVAAVVTGAADIYVHAGGQYEWDSAAPVAVALAAGLHATRLDGSPLEYNRRDPWLPDLCVCAPALAGDVLAALAAASRSGSGDARR